VVTLLVPVQQTTSPQHQPLALPTPAAQACALNPAAAIPPLLAPQQASVLAPFRCLTPTKMLERRHAGHSVLTEILVRIFLGSFGFFISVF